MTLDAYESSRDAGQPVELYAFIYGEGGESYYYTNADDPITFEGATYTPISIDREKIETGGKLEGREVKIELPITAEVADLFRIFPPSRIVNAVIRQGHVGDPDVEFPVVWTGRVLEAQRDDPTCTLVCEALSAGMRRPGLRRHYQWPCSLALYGPRCQATKTAIPATVATLTGNRVTLTAGWIGAYVPANFVGGLIEWQGANGKESRGILRVENTNTLLMSGPPLGLAAAQAVEVFLGCPHTLAGCGTLHNNAVNYGGHPWIPSAGNPVGKNNHT